MIAKSAVLEQPEKQIIEKYLLISTSTAWQRIMQAKHVTLPQLYSNCQKCQYIYVTGFHITRLPHTQNQTYDFTRNGLLV